MQDERDPTAARIHGVVEGDELRELLIEDCDGTPRQVVPLVLHLDAAALGLSARYGASWAERVARLRADLGPFVLAVLETVLRAADARASQAPFRRGDDEETRS